MSVVLNVITSRKSYIMCDGRKKTMDSDLTVDELVAKIFPVNENLVFGATGWYEMAIKIFSEIPENSLRTMSADTAAYRLSKIGKSIFANGVHSVQLIITGVTSKNQIRTYTLQSPLFEVTEYKCPANQSAFHICLHNLPLRSSFEQLLSDRLRQSDDTLDATILRSMKDYICGIAKYDDSVNDNTFYKLIKLPLHSKKR